MIIVGVIGIGRIGRLHIENIEKMSNVYVKTVADPQIEKMSDWLENFAFTTITNNPIDIFNDEEIDAVLICSPTASHLALIKAAAKARKHIFCEKPISFSARATKDALETVKEAGVQFQTGFNRRFDKSFQDVQKQVAEGRLGELHTVRITSRDAAPPSLHYVKSSGGLFKDMMIHDFDMARFITQSEVVEVYAKGHNFINPKVAELGDVDTAMTLLTFANGVLAMIENSRQTTFGYDQRLEAFGEKGALTVGNQTATTVRQMNHQGISSDLPYNDFLQRYQQAYKNEITSFVQAIEENETVSCTGVDGWQAERIAEAARKSKLTGRPVQLAILEE